MAAELKLDCGGQAKGESRKINRKMIAAVQAINGPGVETEVIMRSNWISDTLTF